MTIAKGEIRNPYGSQGKASRRALTKLQHALDKAIDLLGNDISDGTTVLAGKIKDKLESDPVGTIKALSPLFPKDVSIDVSSSQDAQKLSDSELADIIAKRARNRLEQAKDITELDMSSPTMLLAEPGSTDTELTGISALDTPHPVSQR